MYSKAEVCFTVMLAVAVSCCFGSQGVQAETGTAGPVLTLADGGHPPPPPRLGFTGEEALQADGGHPPPPTPWSSSFSQLS